MKKKIIGIFVCMLLIAAANLSVAEDMNVSEIMYDEECGCCQNSGQPIPLPVGKCDNFTLPTEPTYPWTHYLLDWIGEHYYTNDTRDCDETGINLFWAHTFDLEGICNQSYITGATLTITIKNGDYNDGMNLGCIDDKYDTWDVSKILNDTPPIGWGVPFGSIGTVVIDLSGDYPSCFNEMVSHGWLDVIVQDDSVVDCGVLTIYCCDCELEVNIEPSLYLLAHPILVTIRNIGTTDCDNIGYTITCKRIIGTASCAGSTGNIPSLPPSNDALVYCNPRGFGIAKITVTAEACNGLLVFTDTAYALVIGSFFTIVFG